MSDPTLDETLQDRRRSTPGPHAPRAAHLFLALECGAPLAGPSRHSLANIDEVIVGRGSERGVSRNIEGGVRQLVLRVADPRMSARHARLRCSGGTWSFEDLASTNGSRIDGTTVTRTTLEDRALLELGHSVFLFRSELITSPQTAGDVALDDLRGQTAAFVTLIPNLAAAFDTLARIAASSVPVLLEGETGSGKELLARAIHAASARSGEFVAINCGALRDSPVEAQLFGSVDAGASHDQLGYMRAAHQGTLFLDEISELPAASQAALLRVLQENEIVPVGATRPIAVDVRVVTATHAPIDDLVLGGAFRNDLFARISGFRFSALPLRDRIEDIGLLIANLLQELLPAPAARWNIEPAAAFALFSYDWPRNIRELKQCLASAAVLGSYRSIELGHLPRALIEPRPSSRRPSAAPAATGLGQRTAQLDEQLRRDLIALFTECKGNVSEVARRMGKARVQIQRWLKRFAIDPAAFKD